jgi:hypothetical protein
VLLVVLVGTSLVTPARVGQGQRVDLVDRTALRVCADSANMPFSSDSGEGFESTSPVFGPSSSTSVTWSGLPFSNATAAGVFMAVSSSSLWFARRRG